MLIWEREKKKMNLTFFLRTFRKLPNYLNGIFNVNFVTMLLA